MSSRAKKPVKCQSGSIALARYRKILEMVKAKHPRMSAAQHRAKAKKLYKTLPPLKGFTKVCKRGAGFEQDHPLLSSLYDKLSSISKSSPGIRALQMLGGRPKFKPISNEETKRILAAIKEEENKMNMRDDNLEEDMMEVVNRNPVPSLDLPVIDEEEDYEAPMLSDFNLMEDKPKRARKPAKRVSYKSMSMKLEGDLKMAKKRLVACRKAEKAAKMVKAKPRAKSLVQKKKAVMTKLSKKLEAKSKPKARKSGVRKPKAKSRVIKRKSMRGKGALGGCMDCMGSGCMACGGSQLGGIMGYDYDRPIYQLM